MKRLRTVNANSFCAGLLLLVALCSCSAQDNKGIRNAGDATASVAANGVPRRVMLLTVQALDSARAADPAIVDRMLVQAFDSIPEIEYVPASRRADVSAEQGDSGVTVARLAEELDLDGVISVRVARFGSVVGIDMGVFDPAGGVIFRDRVFSFIRYRDSSGIKLFGPALYDALERAARRLAKLPDSERIVVSAEPLIVSNVVIDRDEALGRIAENREKISTDGIRALGDFMRVKYPEFVVFDYESRSRVYETVGVLMVEDHEPVNDLERRAMFNLDLPYYLTTGFFPAGDSVEIRAEVRYVLSPQSDTALFSESRRFPRRQFETSTMVREAVTQLLEVSDEALTRFADRVRDEYAASISSRRQD